MTLAVISQGLLWSSVDPAAVLIDASTSLLLPLCSAAVQTPQWSLHMKLEEILHQCQWLAMPNSKELFSVVELSAGKMLSTPQGLDALSACGGREDRDGDPRCFPFGKRPRVKEKSCSSPQLESPQVMVSFLLHLKHTSAIPTGWAPSF